MASTMTMSMMIFWLFMTLRSWVDCVGARPSLPPHHSYSCTSPCKPETPSSEIESGSPLPDQSSSSSLFSLLASWCLWATPSFLGSASSTLVSVQDLSDLFEEVANYIQALWSSAQFFAGAEHHNSTYAAGYYGYLNQGYLNNGYYAGEEYYVDYYHYYEYQAYYGQYDGCGGGSALGPPTTSTETPTSPSLMTLVRQSAGGLAAVVTMWFFRTVLPRRIRAVFEHFRGYRCWALIAELAAALWSDYLAMARVILRCCSDLALIMVSRSPRARKYFRRSILRLRNLLGNEVVAEGDAHLVEDNVYRPLMLIQREGGRRARWGGHRRWAQIKRKSFRTKHSPTSPGNCLFASFKYIAQRSGRGTWSVKALRKIVQAELRRISASGELVQGHDLHHWAGNLNMTESGLIDNCTGPHQRWGNTLDLLLLAQLFEVNTMAIDTQLGRSLMCHRAHSGVVWCLGLKRNHFTVLHRHYHEGSVKSMQAKVVITQGGMLAAHGEKDHDGGVINDPLLNTCLLDGSRQSVANAGQLRELSARFHDLEDEVGSPPPAAIDWLQMEDEWSRSWLQSDLRAFLACFRVFSLWALPRARRWKQYIRTPPQLSLLDGGGSQQGGRTVPFDGELSNVKRNAGYSASMCSTSAEGHGLCYSLSSLHIASGRIDGLFFVPLVVLADLDGYSFLSLYQGSRAWPAHLGMHVLREGGVASSMPPPPVPPRRTQVPPLPSRPSGVAKVAKVATPERPPATPRKPQQTVHGSVAGSSSKAAASVVGCSNKKKKVSASVTVPADATPPKQSTTSSAGNREGKASSSSSAGHIQLIEQSPPPRALNSDQAGDNSRTRPYPFSPLFRDVQAFPPRQLGEAIEVTAAYAMEFPDRALFEQSILEDSDGGQRFHFLMPEDTYHPYYLAVLRWIQVRKDQAAEVAVGQQPPVASLAAGQTHTKEVTAASAEHSTTTPPPGKVKNKAKSAAVKLAMAKPASRALVAPASIIYPPTVEPRQQTSLEAAVVAVNKRRRTLAPFDDDGLVVDTDSDETSSIPSRQVIMVTPRQPAQQPSTKPHPPQTDRDNRPALQRKRPAPAPQEKKMPRQRVVLVDAPTDPWAAYPQPWSSDARAAQGTLKLACAALVCINHFAKTVVKPLAAVLNIKVLSVGRRGGEPEARVLYVRDDQHMLPVVAASVVESMDILQAIGSVRHRCHHLYMETRLRVDKAEQILNTWSDAGRLAQTALLMVLRGALLATMQSTLMLKPAAAILIPQAHHFTVVVLPLTRHAATELAAELQQHFQDYLDRNPVRAEGREWHVSVSFKLRQGAGAGGCSCNNWCTARYIHSLASTTYLHVSSNLDNGKMVSYSFSVALCTIVISVWSPLSMTPRFVAFVTYEIVAGYIVQRDRLLGSSSLLAVHKLSVCAGGTKGMALRSHHRDSLSCLKLFGRDNGAGCRPPLLTSPSLSWSGACPVASLSSNPLTGVDVISTGSTCIPRNATNAGFTAPPSVEKGIVTPQPTRTPNHIRAFCCAANELHLSITCQEAAQEIEQFIRRQTQLGFCGKLLKDALASVQHIPTQFWPGTTAPDNFVKAAYLDLVILSMTRNISVTVTNQRGKYPLQVLQRPGSEWTLLRINHNLEFEALVVMHANGQASRHIIDELDQDDPVWDSSILCIVAELLSSQSSCSSTEAAHDSSQGSECEDPPAVSSTETARDQLSVPESCALPLRVSASVERDGCDDCLIIRSGAGKRASASSSAVTMHTDQEAAQSDDELPLTALLGDIAQSPPESPPGNAAQQPMVVFWGKFHNGRTSYRQVLWPEMRWTEAHTELNRAVRRRKCLWCMCVNETPVDPDAMVPRAQTPFDTIQGSLRRLEVPLDYVQLRLAGGLCAPAEPTHAGREQVPTVAPPVPAAGPEPRLVDEAYDSGTSTPHSLPVEVGSSVCSTCSSTSSLVPCIELSSQSDDSNLTSLVVREGGGKYNRVQHEAVVESALNRLLADLTATPQGMVIEHKCASRILHSDPYAAKAIFQGQTSCQRYEAFAAALSRAGLTDFARGISVASRTLKSRSSPGAELTGQDLPPTPDAVTDPYFLPAEHAKKRGRPRRDNLGTVVQNGVGVDTSVVGQTQQADAGNACGSGRASPPAQHVSSNELQALLTKIEQIEQWAHGVDKTLIKLPRPQNGQVAPGGRTGSLLEGGDAFAEDVPPTIDYEHEMEHCSVPRRVAEYERIAQEHSEAMHPPLAHSRLVKLETALRDLTTRFVDDPAVMFRNLNANVDRLNEFATEASEHLARFQIFK
eukprot:6477428-Amphidinium_carterae.1